MRVARSFPAFLAVLLLSLCSCKVLSGAVGSNPTPLTTITAAQGGMIQYGPVDGVSTLPGAMAKILSTIHQSCGERPNVGQVFRVKGSNSAGVFFTVVNRLHGNKQVAGMLIAEQVGPNHLEAGLISDSADRFGQTGTAMLQQLFGAWKPSGDPAPAGKSGGSSASGSAPVTYKGAMHQVTAPDNSASMSVPDGWTMEPNSGHGALIVRGPNGEVMAMNMSRPAVDPSNPFQLNAQRRRTQFIAQGSVVYAFRGDLMNEFSNVFQAWRRAGGQGPAPLQVDKIEPMQAAQGNHCVHMAGKMDPDGKGMMDMNDMMCAMDPIPSFGGYSVTLYHALFPLALADKEREMEKAIIGSYRINEAVMNQQIAAMQRQKEMNDQQIMANTQQAINNIHQIGQQATARMNATEAANDAQHAGYWAQQDANARNSAGFSNYLLDQTVVQNNNVAGTGMVGHATLWNSDANALVRANPNKFEIVNTPNYWQGVDY